MENQVRQLMTLCVLAFFGSSASAQSYETAQDAFDARAWEVAAKLARAEAIKGNANSQGLLGQLYHFGQGGLPKSSELAVIWYSVSMANGNTAIEGLYNGAAFVFNEEELRGIEAKATDCLSSQYKNCD
jgi:TPR repeat protein